MSEDVRPEKCYSCEHTGVELRKVQVELKKHVWVCNFCNLIHKRFWIVPRDRDSLTVLGYMVNTIAERLLAIEHKLDRLIDDEESDNGE